MGGAITYVFRDGQRLTPWMALQIERLSADMHAKFGVWVKVRSAIRTYEEQKRIFLERYVTAGNVRGRRVYDTRWWNGRLWYRISSAGTVAVPGTSNHQIQGSKAAVDLYDTGNDAGITRAGSVRANWLRANAWRYGLVPSGYGFREPWHYDVLDIFRAVPAPAGKPAPPTPIPAEPEEVEDDMRPTVHVRTEGGTEYTLASPEFGKDLARHTGPGTGGKRRDGKVTIYKGFMATADDTIGRAWARTYAGGSGNETSRTDRDGYVAIQIEASRVASEFYPA